MDLPDFDPERPRNSGQPKVLVGCPANIDTGKLDTILASHHIRVELTYALETKEPTRTGDIPANVSEGRTGFFVSSDTDREVTAILIRLATDAALPDRISRNTFGQATRRIPRLTDTIDDYKNLFERMRFDLANKTYRRPRRPIQPPCQYRRVWTSSR